MTYIEKLVNQIEKIEPIVDLMYDNSSIYYYNDYTPRNSRIVVIGGSGYRFSKRDEKNQIKAREAYKLFYQNFKLLTRKATPKILTQINNADKKISNIIEQRSVPSSIKNGKINFREQTKVFKDYLFLLKEANESIIIVPDTNSLIQFPNPKSYSKIANSTLFQFIILPTVLSELDKLKINHRNEDFRKKVKSVINRLKGYRKQGNVLDGVIVEKTITLKMIAIEPDFGNTLNWLDPKNNDDRIIASALELQINNPSDKIIFISSDINFQNKAQLANLTIFDTDDLE